MRSALAIVTLLTACTADVAPDLIAHGPPPFVWKADLAGTWSHRAVVIASDAPSVAIGDETSSELDLVVGEDFVVGYTSGRQPRIMLRVESHLDLEERERATGERGYVLVEGSERAWWERDAVRLDPSEELATVSVPTDLPIQPMPHAEVDPGTYGVTWLPARDEAGRLVWSFVSAYWTAEGEVLARHELEAL